MQAVQRLRLTSSALMSSVDGCRYSRRQRKLFCLACLMASVILGTILLSVIVIIIADIPASVGTLDLQAQDLAECSWQQWRLPANVTPTAYSLSLHTQMREPYTVTGTVDIDLHITQPTLCLVISAAAMNITSARLTQPSLVGALAMPRISLCMVGCMHSGLLGCAIERCACQGPVPLGS